MGRSAVWPLGTSSDSFGVIPSALRSTVGGELVANLRCVGQVEDRDRRAEVQCVDREKRTRTIAGPVLDAISELFGETSPEVPPMDEELAPMRHIPERSTTTPNHGTGHVCCGKERAYDDMVYNHEPPSTRSSSGCI